MRDVLALLAEAPIFPFNATESLPGQHASESRRTLALQDLEQYFDRGGKLDTESLKRYFSSASLADMVIALYLLANGHPPEINSAYAEYEEIVPESAA